MIRILLLAVVPFMTQHRNVVPKTEVSTNFYGSVTGIVDKAYIQSRIGTGPIAELPEKWALANVTNAYGKAVNADDVGALPLAGGSLSGKVDGQGWWLDSGNLYIGEGIFIGGDNRPVSIGAYGDAYHLNNAAGYKWFYGDPNKPDNEISVKGDLDNYLPLTGGELSGGVYAQQAIASATTVGAQTIDAWADIRLGSETYYLHNEDECLADYNGKFAHESMISATNPTFSNAVLAVGLNIDTNSVAVLNEIAATFGGFPIEGTATTVGGLLAALAAAAAWLKKNKVQTLKLNDGSVNASAENGVAKLDDFFTNSNGLLNGRLAYSRNATGLKDRAFNALTFDGTEYNLSTALAAVTPTASGQPRDLLIVATATAATTISFTAGTIKGDKPTIDGSGTWLITLTEYASGVWYCRQIKMEDAA